MEVFQMPIERSMPLGLNIQLPKICIGNTVRELEIFSKYSVLIALGEEITEIYPIQITSQSKDLLVFIFNSEIISYSQYYRFNIISVLILVVLNVSLNWYFLTQTEIGILGVAIASFIAMTLFNLAKLIFIYKKFGILPFDKSYAKLIFVLNKKKPANHQV